MVNKYGGGNVRLMGWVDNVKDFYNCISCYIQPSATEGFGLEVLEAQAHGRAVLCSQGAGAVDTIDHVGSLWFRACDVEALKGAIRIARDSRMVHEGEACRDNARKYSWDLIRERYKKVWGELL